MVSDSDFSVANPFRRFKVRYVLLRLVIGMAIALIVFSTVLAIALPISFLEALDLQALEERSFWLSQLYFVGVTGIGLLVVGLGCRKHQIRLKQLIGPITPDLPWKLTLGLAIASQLCLMGFYRVGNALLTYWAPDLVLTAVNQNTNELTEALAASSSPLLFISLIWLLGFYQNVIAKLLIFGLVLHRWSYKWGLSWAVGVNLGIAALANLPSLGLALSAIAFSLIEILLYLKTRSLAPPIVHALAAAAIGYGLVFIDNGLTVSSLTPVNYTLADLRSQATLGYLYLVLGLPWLIAFIYRHWPPSAVKLPYFANAE
ncbi:MAG: hypothetical protein F6K04_18600 [Leptolyngbya sp. SIO4C5]|uniref:hypothetical protein n=1 Tax=Sphaerothrix gracilis TaxID=3151835 RepID=UPI0013C018BE|nr:hypothetical protein [Leptolyngbya sp. SIO4C5]